MIKFTSNNDILNLDCPSVVIIKDSSHDLVKRASAIDKLQYKKTPNQEDLHIIAVGAMEGTGYNRNGDGFPEKDCKSNHHYFSDSKRAVHRHHKNKPGDPKFGNIKAAAYNDAMRRIELVIGLDMDKCADILHEQETTGNSNWSMACTSDPDYPILTNNGYVPIKDIKVGDTVFSHAGNWKKVTELCRSTYSGPLYQVSINGLPEFPALTPNHPLFATIFPESNNIQKQFRYFRDPAEFDKNPPNWHLVDKLKVGDRLYYHKINSFPGFDKIDDLLLAKLLGYYTAEGSITGGCVQLTCNTSDSLPRVIPQIFSERYPDITVTLAPSHSSKVCLNVNIFSSDLVRICKTYAGTLCDKKFIAPEMFNSSDEIKLAFLGCWIDGDGFCDNKGIHISSCNYPLILQGRDLLMSMGIPSSIYKIDHAKCETSGMENSGVEYTLNIAWIDGQKFVEKSQKVFNKQSLITSQDRKKPACLRVTNDPNLFAYRISDIEIEEVTDTVVYNFEVEDDHSYSLGGVISHNSKQAYDICSWCEHKAKTDKDRCEHIPANLGEINKLGEMCGMINEDPHWFEISYVRRPADRIGMSLGKLASELTNYKSAQDCLNLYGELYIPDDITLSKKAEDKRALLHKLSEMEKYVEAVGKGTPTNTKDRFIKEQGHKIKHSPGMDNTSIESLRKMDPGAVLKTLADHGIVFNTSDFSKYLFDSKVSKTKVEGMKSHLPNIFSKLEEDPGKAVNSETFEPSHGHTPNDVGKTVKGLEEGHSLKEGPVLRRIMMIVVSRGEDHKEPTKEACDFEFAKKYAEYQLSALNTMNEAGNLTDDMILNAVLMNQ